MSKVPYKLIINTDSYTGNFERELIAYSFGRLSRGTGGFTAFARPFWDSVVGTGVECYENYVQIEKKRNKEKREPFSPMAKNLYIRKGLSEEEAIKKAMEVEEKVQKRMYDENILRLYEDYLCFTKQEVDDWEEVTFYNIDCYKSNECTSIYVQLNKPLNEYFEKIIIPRIIRFFECDIYNRIKDYIYLCTNNVRNLEKPFKLKDLVLIDENGNVIKDYLKK